MQQPSRWEQSPRLKARGNLSYQDFLRLLEKLWTDAHPKIPLMANANKSFGQYPAIVYRLDLRKPHPSEPKPRYREELKNLDNNSVAIIAAQRFQSVITFTVITQQDPHTAETLIEIFEDFMLEFQPVFKELGVSELLYVRRLPDSADSRPGEGVVSRSVSYLLTTEKHTITYVDKLEKVLINARTFLQDSHEIFIADPTNSAINVRGASYKIGDKVLIKPRPGIDLPAEITTAFYLISNLILTPLNRQYELSRIAYDQSTPSYIPIQIQSEGSGYIELVTDEDISAVLVDELKYKPNLLLSEYPSGYQLPGSVPPSP
jgi:hypothetical protein